VSAMAPSLPTRLPHAVADPAQALGLMLGAGVLVLAVAEPAFALPPKAAIAAAIAVVGPVFPPLFGALVLLAATASVRLARDPADARWRQIGLQASAGLATLALTFTLLGIALGIGSLADRPLTPDGVQAAIGELTGRFAMAFATTVVGLPAAAAFRALLLVLASRRPAVAAVRP